MDRGQAGEPAQQCQNTQIMKKDIILVGGGGHCKSVIDLIRSTGEYHVAGIVDLPSASGHTVMGVPVVGTDVDLPGLRKKYSAFLVTIGQIKDHSARKRIFNALIDLDAELPVIVARSAFVSPAAKLGHGTVVFHQAVVNAEAAIGQNCIINNLSLVEHDAVVGDHSHISTGAMVNGNVNIGEGCFVGSNASIRQGVSIGPAVVVGSGSIVLKDVPAEQTVAGVPARILRP